MSPKHKPTSRRAFLKAAAATCSALAFPTIIPASARGADGHVAPSNRVTMAFIGTGNQGTGDMKGFLQDERVQVIAVCDVNREGPGYWDGAIAGREPARRIVNEHYTQTTGKPYDGCAAYEDFRELLARPDLDAVEVATPDHWHALLTIAAARAGKDIYCQKPFSLTIPEGQAMVAAVRRYGRVLQVGSQQRSDYNFRRACELAINGRIGRVHTIRCGLPGGIPDYGRTAHLSQPQPVPAGFNYDLWLGPAPRVPYCPARCGVNFRWISDYSGGQLTDWGGHHPDIAQWCLRADHTGPVKIRNAQATYASGPLYNTATDYSFDAVYADGTVLNISNQNPGGVTFEGTEGTLRADRGWHDAEPKSILTSVLGPDAIRLYDSRDHFRDFIDCVLSRRDPVAPAEAGHRSITIAHLGNIAMMLGRDLTWDPEKEEIVGDPQAAALIRRAFREPWAL
jgi:predicted dehydrogenase